MNPLTAKIKSLLTGQPMEEHEDDEPKRNPYPNGPATYKTMTNGQVRRMQARARRRTQARNYRETRRKYMSAQAEIAVLRGMLQALGHIPYALSKTPTVIMSATRSARATNWCKETYGSVENAVKRYEQLTGEKVAS